MRRETQRDRERENEGGMERERESLHARLHQNSKNLEAKRLAMVVLPLHNLQNPVKSLPENLILMIPERN